MRMLALIDELEGLILHSMHVPSGKLLVDENSIRQIIDQLREVAPNEARMAEQMARERERVLADTRAQAKRILDQTRGEVGTRLQDDKRIQAAQEHAQSIIAEAEQRAAQLQAQTDQYVVTQLRGLENRLQLMLREAQAGQHFLAHGGNSEDPANKGGTNPKQ